MAYAQNTHNTSCRRDDVVYFAGDSSDKSWAGVIGDEYDMTDDQVKDYIKSTKPELFTKLHGMRFGSSDIPLTFKPMRALRRLDSIGAGRQARSLTDQLRATSICKSVVPAQLTSHAERAHESTLHSAGPFPNKPPYQDITERDKQHDQDQLKLDGVAQKDILSAAERLYPRIEPAKILPVNFHDKNEKPDQAFNYPPHSKEALDRRALKQLEINEILAEVSKYEEKLKEARLQLRHLELRNPSPDASVLITRPFYMEPSDDRYKKQGLTKYDREKYTKELRRTSDRVARRPVKDMSNKLLYCYCREPDNRGEMIRCSKKWCPIGWFHLDCTGLDRLPFLNEEFLCCYCSDGLGRLVTDAHLDRIPHGGTDIAGKLVGTVSQQYLDNEIETEVVFKEQDARYQKGTNVPGRFSIYNDEYDDEGHGIGSDFTDDGSWAAEEYARVRDKVVKWQAVNDPHQRSNVHGEVLRSTENRKPTTCSRISFFEDDSDDSQNGEDEDLASESDTLRASSPIPATVGFKRIFNNDKENYAGNFDQEEGVVWTDSEMTAVDPAGDADDEDEDGAVPHGLAYHGHPIVNPRDLSSNSRPTANTQHPFTPQHWTTTDSTHPRANNSQSSSFMTTQYDPPTHSPSFIQPPTGPRTPTLAPIKSRKPWGTPVNFFKDFDAVFGCDLVTEPGSPSPDKKRKFAQVSDGARDGMESVYGGDEHDEEEVEEEQISDRESNGVEYILDDENSEEEEGEMAQFMLDQ